MSHQYLSSPFSFDTSGTEKNNDLTFRSSLQITQVQKKINQLSTFNKITRFVQKSTQKTTVLSQSLERTPARSVFWYFLCILRFGSLEYVSQMWPNVFLFEFAQSSKPTRPLQVYQWRWTFKGKPIPVRTLDSAFLTLLPQSLPSPWREAMEMPCEPSPTHLTSLSS